MLSGGLDTAELKESFSGLQEAQEITQRALGSLSAYLSSTMSFRAVAASSSRHGAGSHTLLEAK